MKPVNAIFALLAVAQGALAQQWCEGGTNYCGSTLLNSHLGWTPQEILDEIGGYMDEADLEKCLFKCNVPKKPLLQLLEVCEPFCMQIGGGDVKDDRCFPKQEFPTTRHHKGIHVQVEI